MLVYGDRAHRVDPREAIASLSVALRRSPQTPAADLQTQAFIEAGMLAQGLIDAEFEDRGCDDLTPLHGLCLDLLLALARGQSGEAELRAVAALPAPASVELRNPEGYAYYAVYPEAWREVAAARRWVKPPFVIGLRSIGAGLAAMAAAGAGAARLVSLRPCGPPFRRELRVSQRLRACLAAHEGAFAIADEGPGMSGSSFGCVADLLEELGADPARIVFLPSHAGDLGPQASEPHRRRWRTAVRPTRTLDDIIAEEPIARWFADIVGDTAETTDLSGGAWRAGPDAPAYPARERRKFRIASEKGTWVARFAGLGQVGAGKLARARALHAAGYGPQPFALRRGFLLQSWEAGSPVDPAGAERPSFLSHLGRYLGFRARAFPAQTWEGADGQALCEMARKNAGLQLTPPAPGLRAHIDGKLQAYEWLRRPAGGYCKLDALDHSSAHDLVGCQEIAWDVAGAKVEFDLSPAELAALVSALRANGGPDVDACALAFHEACYAAFHFGLWSMAGDAPCADRERARYQRRLACFR